MSSEDNDVGEDGRGGETSEPYRTGYAKPPRNRQFKPSQSGNPRGRPRKQREGQAGPLDRLITVREGGEVKEVNARELALRQAVKKALVDDDTKAQLYLLEEFLEHGLLDAATEQVLSGVIKLSDPAMPFTLQVMLFERFGPPPGRRHRSPKGARSIWLSATPRRRARTSCSAMRHWRSRVMADGKRGRGRPRGSQNTKTLLRTIAEEKVTVRDASGAREVTVLDAIILRLQLKEAKGDIAIMRKLERLRQSLRPAAGITPGVLLTPGTMSAEEWIAQQEKLNIIRQPPEGITPPKPPPASPPGPGAPKHPGKLGPAADARPSLRGRLVR